MKFTEQFNKYACVGDSIRLRISDDVSVVAKIIADNDRKPGDFDCYTEADICRWRRDEWFFCAVSLSLEVNRREIKEQLDSLWGVECNYGEDNSYLTEVANELLNDCGFDEIVAALKDTARAARAGVKAIEAFEKEASK